MKDQSPRTRRSSVDREEETAREQGQEVQEGQAGNAATLASQPPAEPNAEDPEETSALQAALKAALTSPDDPADPAMVRGKVDASGLPSRAATYNDMGFWSASFWAEASVAKDEVRGMVDPLAKLADLSSVTDPEARAEAVRSVLTQVPGEKVRVVRDPALRAQLLSGMTGLGRVRVLQAATNPETTVDDPYFLLQQAVAQGDAAQLNDAWADASVDPSITIRLASDLALMTRIEAIDSALAGQIRWELSRTVEGGLLETPDQIFEVAAQAALIALQPLVEGFFWFAPDGAPMLAAVDAYEASAVARLDASQMTRAPDFDLTLPDAARAALAQQFHDLHGKTLGEALGVLRDEAGKMLSVRYGGIETDDRAQPLAERQEEEGQSPDTAGATEVESAEPAPAPWSVRGLATARRHAPLIHQASGGSGGLMGWLGLGEDAGTTVMAALTAAQTQLREVAQEPDLDAAGVEARVSEGLRWLGAAYEAQYGSIGELLAGISDAGQKSRTGQLLGASSDPVAEATLAMLRAEPELSEKAQAQRDTAVEDAGGEDSFKAARDATLISLSAKAELVGRQLAAAVMEKDEAAALAAARDFESAQFDAVATKRVSAEELGIFAPIIEAAFAPVAGDLGHALGKFDNGNDIASALGMHSLGAAQREDGDTRSDALLEAEFNVDERVTELFKAVANSDSDIDTKLSDALVGAADYDSQLATDKAAADPDAAVQQLEEMPNVTRVRHTYNDLFGIDPATHIGLNTAGVLAAPKFAATFKAGDAIEGEAVSVSLVNLDFFRLDGNSGFELGAESDPNAVSDQAKIAEMTQLHVDKLTEHAEAIASTLHWMSFGKVDGFDGLPRLINYVGHLQTVDPSGIVKSAFRSANGAEVEFYIHQAQAQGGLDAKDADAGLRALDDGAMSDLAIDMRNNADSGDWNMLLQDTERASKQAREGVLADGATIQYVRERIKVPVVWTAVYDSLHGELDLATLLADESQLTEWMETLGTAGWWLSAVTSLGITAGVQGALGINISEAMLGVDEKEYDFDEAGIIEARREDMTDGERALDAARASVDSDVHGRLDNTVGGGDDRLSMLDTLGDTGGDSEREELHDADRSVEDLRALGRGKSGLTEAAKVDDDTFYTLDTLRTAIQGMSDADRRVAAADPFFIDRIDRVTAGNATAAEELFDLLYSGSGGADAARIEAYGDGIDGTWFYSDEWAALDALVGMSDADRVKVSMDETERAKWIQAAEGNAEVIAQMTTLFDTSAAKLGAVEDAEGQDQTADTDWKKDPVAKSSYDAFVARSRARFGVAFNATTEREQAVLKAAAAVAADARKETGQDSPARGAHAAAGWPVNDAMDAIRRPVSAEFQKQFDPRALLRDMDDRQLQIDQGNDDTFAFATSSFSTNDKLLWDVLTQWEAATFDERAMSIYRAAANESGGDAVGMVEALKLLSDEKFARELTSINKSGLQGEESLYAVYYRYKDADEALKAAEESGSEADIDRLRAAQQLAGAALRDHPVEVATGAALAHSSGDGRGSINTVDSLSTATRETVLAAIRGRIRKLETGTIAKVLRADEAHLEVIWDSTKNLDLSVREAGAQADRVLTAGSMGTEFLSAADDEAASRRATLAQSYQKTIADQDVSQEEKARMDELQAELGVSVQDFQAAKKKMADTASAVAAVAASAIVTVATAGTGAPVAAALLTTALGGGAGILLQEAIRGEDHDADVAVAELGVELLKTAATAHLDKLWVAGKAAAHAQLIAGPNGRKLVMAHKMLSETANSYVGEFGMSLAGAAVDTATGDIQDVAFSMLDPSMYEYGWDNAIDRAMLDLDTRLQSLDERTMSAIMSEFASQIGQMAAEGTRRGGGGGMGADDLGVDLDIPNPNLEPKAYREYLLAQLKKVPQSMLEAGVSTGVTGLVNQAGTELQEYVVTGDVDLDLDAMVGVLKKSAIASGKAGWKGVKGAHKAAKQDLEHAQLQHERLKLLDTIDHGLTDDELELYKNSMKGRGLPDAYGAFQGQDMSPAEERDALAAAVRGEVAAFREEVIAPLHGQIEAYNSTWGADLSDGDRAAYEEWVLSDISQAPSRVQTNPGDFMRRLDDAKAAIERQRDSVGYGILDEHSKRWFEHAAANPAEFVDLTRTGAGTGIQVGSVDEAEAFMAGLPAAERSIAEYRLGVVIERTTMTDEQKEWALANGDTLLEGIRVPAGSGEAIDSALELQLEMQWEFSREKQILDRLVQTS